MKKIEEYIFEKFKISIKNSQVDIHKEISFNDWIEYLDEIDLTYEILREEKDTSSAWAVKIKNTKAPAFNIILTKPNRIYFTISSIHLGEYDGKFDKISKFTDEWWEKGFDIKGKGYLFTMNNANLLKEKLQDIIDISK